MKNMILLVGVLLLTTSVGCSPRKYSYKKDLTTKSSCETLWLFDDWNQTSHKMKAIRNFWASKSVNIIDKPHPKYGTRQVELHLNDPDVNFVMLIIKKRKKHISIYQTGICFKKPVEKSEAKRIYQNVKEGLILPILR